MTLDKSGRTQTLGRGKGTRADSAGSCWLLCAASGSASRETSIRSSETNLGTQEGVRVVPSEHREDVGIPTWEDTAEACQGWQAGPETCRVFVYEDPSLAQGWCLSTAVNGGGILPPRGWGAGSSGSSSRH